MKKLNMAALVAVATVLANPFRALAAVAASKQAPELTLSAPTLPAMPRAIAGTVRADAADPATLIRALNGAFDEFKTTHAREIEEIKAGKTDVLTKDKLDAINATLTELQTAVDDQARINAAAKLGDGAVIGDIKSDPEYTKAFKAHMRRGDNASADVRAAMQKGTDTDGGYLAPIEWDRTIGEKLKKISPMRAESRVITISVAGFKKYFSDRNVGRAGSVKPPAVRRPRRRKSGCSTSCRANSTRTRRSLSSCWTMPRSTSRNGLVRKSIPSSPVRRASGSCRATVRTSPMAS